MDGINAADEPGLAWQSWTHPADAGLDAAALSRALTLADSAGSACLMIVRGGRTAAGFGDPARKLPCHSIRKSLLSALIGIAVEEGRIDLAATLEELDIDDHLRLSAIERAATVYDLLTARSGIMHPAGYESARMKRIKPPRHLHAPATRWTHNNWDFNALGTIYERCTGETIPEAFARRIAVPIGMEDFSLAGDPPDAGHVDFDETRHRAYPLHHDRARPRALPPALAAPRAPGQSSGRAGGPGAQQRAARERGRPRRCLRPHVVSVPAGRDVPERDSAGRCLCSARRRRTRRVRRAVARPGRGAPRRHRRQARPRGRWLHARRHAAIGRPRDGMTSRTRA